MAGKRTLLDHIGRIRQVRDRIDELAATRPEGWQRDYANARLALQDEMTALGQAAALAPQDGADGSAGSAFHAALARSKSVLASHQARWPVILMKSEDPAYHASVAQVNEEFDQLAAAVRALPAD